MKVHGDEDENKKKTSLAGHRQDNGEVNETRQTFIAHGGRRVERTCETTPAINWWCI